MPHLGVKRLILIVYGEIVPLSSYIVPTEP